MTIERLSALLDFIETNLEEQEDISYLTEQFESVVTEVIPVYTELSFSETKGYFFRPNEEELLHDIRDGWVINISDLSEIDDTVTADYALLTNDHGNRTLYGLDDLENPTVIWEVV